MSMIPDGIQVHLWKKSLSVKNTRVFCTDVRGANSCSADSRTLFHLEFLSHCGSCQVSLSTKHLRFVEEYDFLLMQLYLIYRSETSTCIAPSMQFVSQYCLTFHFWISSACRESWSPLWKVWNLLSVMHVISRPSACGEWNSLLSHHLTRIWALHQLNRSFVLTLLPD